MKKKKQTPAADGGVTAATPASIDMKTLIRESAAFFDELIDQIPAKFYLPADEDKPWFQGLSKAEKAAAKQKSIENTKKSRRDRLDPDKAARTTEILRETLAKGGGDGGGDEKRSVTVEELRERLHRKMEELRAARGGGEVGEGKRKEKREERKRKRESEREGGDGERREKERADVEKEVEEAARDIEFGKVKLATGIEDVLSKKKKKRKLSKEEELKRALELEEAKKDPEQAKKHAWRAATERAMGKKVHDNPKLLMESLKKEKKKHEKSIKKWKQRERTSHKMQKEKQDKRKGNIKAKIDRKKQMKIEKREKKLMRAGFEGRKEGFVTGD